MKRVNVNAYQVALVFKNGVYKKMLREGNYWLWNGEQVLNYDLTMPFAPLVELNILLQDKALADALLVVDVKEEQIALQYQEGLLKNVLGPGRYTFWKSVVNYEFIMADTSKIEITEPINQATLYNRILAPYVRNYTVENYEKALLFVDGKFVKALGPGVYNWWKNNTIINVAKVDARSQQIEINGQEILTKDKAALRINGFAQYRVVDVQKALMNNKEYDRQLYVAFQFALREYIAVLTFDELLERKETLTPFVLEAVKAKEEALGVEVSGFGIRDIVLPGDVRDIMNQVLVAEKKAQANSITRREETASTRSLLNTAKLMEDNQMLWKLKEMEYVEKIAEKVSNISLNGNTVLIDQLKQIFVPQK